MAGLIDFIGGTDGFVEDFLGAGTIPTTPSAHCPWVLTDTSPAGAPVVAVDTVSNGGILTMSFASTVEIENLCVSYGDRLAYDIDKLVDIEFYIKVLIVDPTTSMVWGLTSNRNDDPDATAANAQFKLFTNLNVVCETDDAVRDIDDISAGTTAIGGVNPNTYRRYTISFSKGTNDVRFYIDGVRVAASQVFNMSSYTGSLQPNIQMFKSANANQNTLQVDYIQVRCRR